MELYYTEGSAPCRAVRLTAMALGVDLTLKLLDLAKGENMTPDFIKMNPQHCVPTLKDGDLVLWESRAILMYLVDKYGKDDQDSLYPKDPVKRALVNQRLFFDMGTLYQRFGDIYYPMLFSGASLDTDKLKKLEEAFSVYDLFLGTSKYAAGSSLTIADHALAATVSTAEAVGFDIKKYPNVAKWYSLCQETMEGYEECNAQGANAFKAMFQAISNN